MSFFSRHAGDISYPSGDPGFREAQLAAIHSVNGHFFSSDAPAIVVMPTGSGKTTVAVALAFLLKAKRVLVITPSRLLRDQISEKFESLSDLEKIGAFPLHLKRPEVRNQSSRIKSTDEWHELERYDVVVSTVYGISGIKTAIPEIPEDLFDLVIVDEAHHAPAATWVKALEQLKGAKQVFLTATPFRRDGREIGGKIAFRYDIRRAYKDQVFGDLNFRPAIPVAGQDSDHAIAQAAEKQFKEDRSAGLQHRLMVRVDSLARAKELQKVYAETSLNLKLVSGSHSLKHVRRVTSELQKGEIDGIICVNMFGEGFDLPSLKIAALHAPHKSLAVTLQFIGRFARTTDSSVGDATFVAFPEEQKAELKELWTSDALWPEIVHNLSAARIEREFADREVFETFQISAATEFGDLALSSLETYFHAKIFRCYDGVSFDGRPLSSPVSKVVYSATSADESAIVNIRQTVTKPRWTNDFRFESLRYDLDVIYYDSMSQLLFVSSTEKTVSNYQRIASTFSLGRYAELSSATINRALNDIGGLRFFNVGMRRKQFGGRSESYRISAGPGADIELSEADGQSYFRGHSFGKGKADETEVTIGISTSSKIWSNASDSIAAYVTWCRKLAGKLSSAKAKPTGSRLDYLSAGQAIEELPGRPIYALFQGQTYQHSPSVFSADGAGKRCDLGLLADFEIAITDFSPDHLEIELRRAEGVWGFTYFVNAFPIITKNFDNLSDLFLDRAEEPIPLEEYLNDFPPRILLENFDFIEGNTLFDGLRADVDFHEDELEIVDWNAEKVNIAIEKPDQKEIKARSIFDYIEDRLVKSDAKFVFNDDGPGEIADFITLTETNGINRLSLYHCKASKTEKAGSRLEDLYDVCGQAIRSAIWVAGDRLVSQLFYRQKLPSIKGLLKGDFASVRDAFSPAQRLFLEFEVVIVQPGVSISSLKEGPKELLLATKKNTRSGSINEFRLMASE